MEMMGTSWNKDYLIETSSRTTIVFNATEQFAAAAGHFLIGAADNISERAQMNDDPAIDAVASRVFFSAVIEADYTFVMKEGSST